MYRLLAILALLSATVAQNHRDFDSIIESFFGPGLSTTAKTGGTGQNVSGTDQNTSSPAQNISGTGQNTESNGNVLSSSTVALPSTLPDQVSNTFAQNNNREIEDAIELLFRPINTTSNGTGAIGTTQNKSSPAENKDGPAQNKDGPVKNAGDTGENAGVTNNTSCMTANYEVGECVPYYLCDLSQNTDDDDYGIIDPHVEPENSCQSYLETCCRKSNKITMTNPITTPEQNNKVGPAQNTDGTGQNNGGTENVSATSTIASPPEVSDVTNGTTCVMADLEVGECVPYYLCDQNQTVGYNGDDLIDIHIPLNVPCESYLDTTCCRKSNKTTTTKTPETKREGCGYSNPDGFGKRITGNTSDLANFGEFPWVVAIIKIEPLNENEPEGKKREVYVGGGSLIHPSVVLTAAHVAAAATRLRVRAGEWDTQTTHEIYPYQDRDVAKVEIHNDYNKGNLFYDIALVFLTAPVDPAPNVGVVCLPPPREKVKGGTKCLTSGWGKEKFGRDNYAQVILNKVEVPVVERQACLESLRKTRLGSHFELHTSFMCAGGAPGQDSCKRDGGSPLICPIEFEPDRYMQSGIVAWGIGCGEDGTPGVYVDVANLRAWVDDKVKGKGYLIDGYSYTV